MHLRLFSRHAICAIPGLGACEENVQLKKCGDFLGGCAIHSLSFGSLGMGRRLKTLQNLSSNVFILHQMEGEVRLQTRVGSLDRK